MLAQICIISITRPGIVDSRDHNEHSPSATFDFELALTNTSGLKLYKELLVINSLTCHENISLNIVDVSKVSY